MQERVALFIGNGAYSNIARLRNPAKDAVALARMFQALGFSLIGDGPLIDANRAAMEAAIAAFSRALGRGSVGLFYFSGHGLQIGGANYLCPVDAGAARETHIESELVDAARLLASMEAANTALNILILDACRSDPFEGRSFRSTTGLAAMQARAGTIISYATQPGHVAYDGEGENSPFANALLEVLPAPGQDVLQAFNRAGVAVRARTNGSQTPWMSASPIDATFTFGRPAAAPAPAPPEPTAPQPSLARGAWWADAVDEAAPPVAAGASDGPVLSAGEDIGAAIAAATAGATLQLGPGVHQVDLEIDRDLVLVAGGQGAVTLQGAISLSAGRLRLERLFIDRLTNGVGLRIVGGRLELSSCTVRRLADEEPEENAPGGVCVSGAQASAQLDRCRIEGFHLGVSSFEGAQVELEGCEIVGHCPRGTQIALGSFGLVAVGAGLRAYGCEVSAFDEAAWTGEGGSMDLAEVTISNCDSGVRSNGEGARCEATGCAMSNVRFGAWAQAAADLALIDCDIEADEVCAWAVGGGRLRLARCKRLTGGGANVVSARDGGRVVAESCRLFDCVSGLRAHVGGGIEATDCEIFGASHQCVAADAGSVVRLEQCDIHGSARYGVWNDGGLAMSRCTIRDCASIGLFLAEASESEVSGVSIYDCQGSGVQALEAARLALKSCTVVRNFRGVTVVDKAFVRLEKCAIRQNGLAVYVGESAAAEIEACDLRDCRYPSIVSEKGGRVSVSASQLTPALAYQGTEGSGGRSNQLSAADVIYGERGLLLDEVQDFLLEGDLHEWGRETRTSRDGATITYLLTRAFNETVRVMPLNMKARIAESVIANNGGPLQTVATPLYELRMDVRISTHPGPPGLDIMSVAVDEHEDIDRAYQTGKNFGTDWSVPSNICPYHRGDQLLHRLRRKFTPSER